MSREERKMAQIIASIERMEQETRASGDDTSRAQEPHDWTKQGGRGKKGKKTRFMAVKVKSSKKVKVSAGTEGAKTPFERKLTPKKRWIQLWSAQMDTDKEKACGISSLEDVEKETEEKETVSVSPVSTSPMSDVKVSDSELLPCRAVTVTVDTDEEARNSLDKVIDVPATAPPLVPFVPTKKKAADVAASVPMPTSAPEQFAEVLPKTITTQRDDMISMVSSSSSELRVKTPLNNESSHLSPPLERNSPTTTASISPSAKVKDTDPPNNSNNNNSSSNTAATVSKFSPAATEQVDPVMTAKKDLSTEEAVGFELERESSSSSSSVIRKDNNYRRESSDYYNDRGRKRSTEQIESPMSKEAMRRAERRRKRKSNWDVGDPRKGGSPVADPPISAAAAAANQQSFAKYPPNRPSWRHSQSMMDMKPHFSHGHRASSFYNNGPNLGGRRGFYHSNLLPLDRSRSAGRSSSRYNYGNANSSNYR